MRRRFFVDHFDAESATLRGDAAAHLGRVLRAEPGHLYELSDGERVWLARVERVAVNKREESRIQFSLVEPVAAEESALKIWLLISLVKFDRFEWSLEKATELGANEIIPLAAARSEKQLIAAAEKRRDRWQKILVESAQQSRRLRQPRISSAVHPAIAFSQCRAEHKILLSERGDAPSLRSVLTSVGYFPAAGGPPASPATAALAIGPEGGWTVSEIEEARAAGFAEASLGENILRTETAVIASLAALRFAWDI
jgi:16S rRNA (uracil1498-N3)-methyltransferase